MKLSSFSQGKDNNFHLIRIVSAFSVLASHSFAMATRTGSTKGITESLCFSSSTIAVDIFFIISGFLVTSSLFTRQSLVEFVWARILRIFPALLIMLLLTVFGLGVFFTSLPLSSYLTDSRTYYYFLKCVTLFTGVASDLPGVFEENLYKNVVNGSLWTMPHEIRLYMILTVIWLILRTSKQHGRYFFQITILVSCFLAGLLVFIRHFYISTDCQFTRLFFMFFSGAAFYVMKMRIELSLWYFWLSLIALLLSAFISTHLFFVVYMLTIAYILLYIAFIPSGLIRNYNRAGDYSYGIYIYSFPVQQSVAALLPGISIFSLFVISASATIVFAALSWHFLERYALSKKEICVVHTRRTIATTPMGSGQKWQSSLNSSLISELAPQNVLEVPSKPITNSVHLPGA
ncbi:MAG: acyltransferase [Proteobacteria bacterium]|nr:acyltransferase [Pseudomonadota bacterium]